MNLKLLLSFDGTNFYGWQYQPNKRTVSGEIINVLKNFVDGGFKLIGCGRTDAGVHAINFVANLKFDGRLRVPMEKLREKMNALLPGDVFLKDISVVDEDFHARYSAKSKIYRYIFTIEYDPLMRFRAFYIKGDLDVDLINGFLKVFLGRHNFGGLSADERENKFCTIFSIHISEVGRFYYLDVEGDRFLRKMVRFLAGAVLKFHEGKISKDEILNSLKSGQKVKVEPLPPYGLYLLDVKY
jgi:tRNA pseudouridine38-40 synthase